MGSRNAFATDENDLPHPTNGSTPDRPAKRLRLAEDAVASICYQISNADTSLEVDHMILDYLAHQTIEACLGSRMPERQGGALLTLASNLAMADSFMSIFKARHPSYKPAAELRLRLRLSQMATLCTQRFTPNPTTPSRDVLRALRVSNQQRARQWIGVADRIPSARHDTEPFDQHLPIHDAGLERNRAHVLHQLGLPAEDEHYEDAFYGTASCVSLLDLIPLFMQLSAARNAMNESNLTAFWMELASELMVQACLEQYLVVGAHGTDAVDEAFAWGHKPAKHDSPAPTNGAATEDLQDEVNAMFEDEDYEVDVEGWKDMKTSYLELLFAASPVDGETAGSGVDDHVTRLETVAAQHPIETLETLLLTFLSALSDSMPRPVLVQLEQGKLDGMTKQQTDDFLADLETIE
ncbi:hypothetical protein LTR09_003144 [Extremus antarcticus]|uniref:Uncharacterized protein n=1 Tax=Extremus antarcticus TaxID=702011 RepID=A0AAJ0GED7_9PEZI|nr:hypothetical protein LTR09_003144 [Extremus antarcticus]